MSVQARVPVVPNAARIRGRSQAPPASGRMKVVVESADDVDGMPNFARDYVGQSVELQVPEGASAPAAGQPFRATVSFRGDERGGQFVVKGSFEKG